jgi:pilus assembly protein Flp/PilA
MPGRGIAVLTQRNRGVRAFLRNEDGPTAVEYAVMLALIIAVCLAAITTLGNNANTTFKTLGTKLGSASS